MRCLTGRSGIIHGHEGSEYDGSDGLDAKVRPDEPRGRGRGCVPSPGTRLRPRLIVYGVETPKVRRNLPGYKLVSVRDALVFVRVCHG